MTTTMGSLDLSALNNLYDETQYFWFESSAQPWGAGAHVTLYPQSEFTTSTHANYLKGQNILMNTDGFSLRNGTLPMMTLDNNSLDFNVVDTTAGTCVTTATFTSTGAQIGQSGAAHSVIDANGQRFYGGSNGTTQLANIGYGEGASASGTDIAPYYTFGTRASGSTIGNNSMAEGVGVTASGFASHAEGYHTISSGHYSHAEGNETTASNYYSHAEGSDTTASGYYCHAEGRQTTASVTASHAEGAYTTASGNYSHAEGLSNTASGNYSHCGGRNNYAAYDYQTVFGKYNDNKSTNLFEIGNGTSLALRQNAFEVDTDGNTIIAGTITAENHASPIGTRKVTTGSYSVATGTDYVTVPTTSLTRLSLEAGSWIITLNAQYSANATGRRGCAIYNVTASSRFSRSEVNQNAVSGVETKLQSTINVVLDTTSTITAQVAQNSGSARTCSLVLDAMRIA